MVAWRKALRDLFSSCFWGGWDVPIATFPFRVQLTLLSNHCSFLTQIAPWEAEKKKPRGNLSTAQWAQKPTRVRVGKEGSSMAGREALQPLLSDVINSFWDVGRLV